MTAAERRGSARLACRFHASSPLLSGYRNQSGRQPFAARALASNECTVLIYANRLQWIYRMVTRVVAVLARCDDVVGRVLPTVALRDQVFCRRSEMNGIFARDAVRDADFSLALAPHRGSAVMAVSALQFKGGMTQLLSRGHRTLGSRRKTPAPHKGRPGKPDG